MLPSPPECLGGRSSAYCSFVVDRPGPAPHTPSEEGRLGKKVPGPSVMRLCHVHPCVSNPPPEPPQALGSTSSELFLGGQ